MSNSQADAQIPAPPQFLGAIHEGVPTRNLEAALRFYQDVLGLRLLPRPNFAAGGAWLGDDRDTVQFHLIVTDDYVPGPDAKISPTGRHTAWRVADLDAFCQRMTALGIEFIEGANLPTKQILIKDPDGHTWEFQGPLNTADRR